MYTSCPPAYLEITFSLETNISSARIYTTQVDDRNSAKISQYPFPSTKLA